MKGAKQLRKKVQAMCDSYAAAYPLKEMSELSGDSDKMEAAIKWIALAALHGTGDDAEKIELKLNDDKQVTVKATYRKSQLPTPDIETVKSIFKTLKDVLKLEDGEMPLALDIRDSDIDLKVKMKKKEKEKLLTIKFLD